MVNFKEKNIIFQGSGGGTNFSRGGGGCPTFSRGSGGGGWGRGGGGVVGGVHFLFPIETNITCDLPAGFRTPCPPSGSALGCDLIIYLVSQSAK